MVLLPGRAGMMPLMVIGMYSRGMGVELDNVLLFFRGGGSSAVWMHA